MGERIAILGFGPIGAMASALAHHLAAAEIFVLDKSDRALEQARSWAREKRVSNVRVLSTADDVAEETVREIVERTSGGVDLVLEMSGAAPAINLGLKILRHGGHMSLLGIPSRKEVALTDYTHDVIFKGVTLKAIIGRPLFPMARCVPARVGLDVTDRLGEPLGENLLGHGSFDSHEA